MSANRSFTQHFINNQWVESVDNAGFIPLICPYTGKSEGVVVRAAEKDVKSAVKAARAAASFSSTSMAERVVLLEAIKDAMKARSADLAAAIHREMGCPYHFALERQVALGLSAIDHTLAGMTGGNRTVTLEELQFGERSDVVQEPVGVVGLITPWNWPLSQLLLKLAPAIAAGCTVVLKPSECCPGAAVILCDCVVAAGLKPGVFNLVQGDAITGQLLARCQGVDMLSFTGSTAAGRDVAIACAQNFKKAHLELGGKAANIILPGTPMSALGPTVGGVLVNAGQNCISPCRVICAADQQQQVLATTIEIFKSATPAVFVANGAAAAEKSLAAAAAAKVEVGPLVNRRQFDRVCRIVKSALEEGATLAHGEHPDKLLAALEEACSKGIDYSYYYPPTVLSGVKQKMQIQQEEIFGPVVCLQTYCSQEEAVIMANDTAFGLSNTITCAEDEQSLAIARALSRKLHSGIVTINTIAPDLSAPFGGIKASGTGREGGPAAMLQFCNTKTISTAPLD